MSNNELTPQEIADYGHEFLNVMGKPRKPGWQAGLECMEAEDEIVRLLCGPGMSVSPQQASAAVLLAKQCVSSWGNEMLLAWWHGQAVWLHTPRAHLFI